MNEPYRPPADMGAGSRPAPASLPYRPHIDGLRAIAVAAVVLYHAGMPGFSGGFVGVDVFFVISGYLITGLLLREVEATGDISLRNFAARRIRRLAPAMFVVLACTLVAGMFVLSPINGEQQALAKSMIATVALSANVYFWLNTGYFQPSGDTQPLLHTWSLSVEEQFYLVWPWLILGAAMLATRLRCTPSRTSAWMLGTVFVVSFAACVAVTSKVPAMAFYLTPLRAWEFAAGGAVVFLLRAPLPNPLALGAMALIGLAGVLGSIRFLDPAQPFPGWIALLPVAASALLIYGCEARASGIAARLLSLRVMVLGGLISYSLYLWHWPLLTLVRVASLEELGLKAALALCALSVVLAWLTYRFVEDPIRRGGYALMATTRRSITVGASMAIVLVVASGSVGRAARSMGAARALDDPRLAALTAPPAFGMDCMQDQPYVSLSSRPNCVQPRNPAVVVWGDSHAQHLAAGLSLVAKQNPMAMLTRTMAGCSPHLLPQQRAEPEPPGTAGCRRFNADVVEELRELRTSGLRAVVIAARWGYYAKLPADWLQFGSDLQQAVNTAQGIGLRVILVGPVPAQPHDVVPCLVRHAREDCTVSRSDAETTNASAVAMLKGIADEAQAVWIVEPMTVLCDRSACSPQPDTELLYFDEHHLNVNGSEKLAPLFAPALAWAVADAR